MMKENKTELEQKIDTAIELFRKDSNITFLEIAKLVKAAILNNKHSENPVPELEVLQKMAKEREKAIAIYEKAGRDDLALKETRELGYIQGIMPKEPSEQEIEKFITELMENTTLTIKDTKDVIAEVQNTFPTAQKSTIVRIFKSLLQ